MKRDGLPTKKNKREIPRGEKREMFKKKKVKVLSHAQMIVEAQDKLQHAQNMFIQAKEEVDAADTELEQVVTEAEAKIAALQATVSNARSCKMRNAKFKAKIAEFIDLD